MNYIDKHLTKLTLSSLKNVEAFKYYYQNKARIYLDEYPEQKELRKEYFMCPLIRKDYQQIKRVKLDYYFK